MLANNLQNGPRNRAYHVTPWTSPTRTLSEVRCKPNSPFAGKCQFVRIYTSQWTQSLPFYGPFTNFANDLRQFAQIFGIPFSPMYVPREFSGVRKEFRHIEKDVHKFLAGNLTTDLGAALVRKTCRRVAKSAIDCGKYLLRKHFYHDLSTETRVEWIQHMRERYVAQANGPYVHRSDAPPPRQDIRYDATPPRQGPETANLLPVRVSQNPESIHPPDSQRLIPIERANRMIATLRDIIVGTGDVSLGNN